jgi:hypothetical protein
MGLYPGQESHALHKRANKHFKASFTGRFERSRANPFGITGGCEERDGERLHRPWMPLW